MVLKGGRVVKPRKIWYSNLNECPKIAYCPNFNEIKGKFINLPLLDQPPFQLSTPFLEKLSTPPLSQFWKTPPHPPLGRGVQAMQMIMRELT